jgi:hypothetical protein
MLCRRSNKEESTVIRNSNELPDDVGTVFVTRVLGAPFQALGRRAPSGELYVGSNLFPTPGRRDQFDDIPEWVEVVTGREAEDLLAELLHLMRSRSQLYNFRGSSPARQ